MNHEETTPSPSSDPFYVNLLAFQFMQGIAMVLGVIGLQRALQAAGLERFLEALPADDLGHDLTAGEYARLHQSIEQLTGRAGRRTLMRVGEAAFQYRWQQPHQLLPPASLVLKSTFPGRRAQKMWAAIAAGRESLLPDYHFTVHKEGELLIYEDTLGAACFGRESDQPLCFGEVGFLQAALAQATGRKITDIVVTETACKAAGAAACRFTFHP